MKRILNKLSWVQILISFMAIAVIVGDYFYENEYHQESIFPIVATLILVLNVLRQAFTLVRITSIFSVISTVGLLAFGLGITLMLMWGTAFQGAEIPVVFNLVIILILAFTISLVAELRRYVSKTKTH